MTWERFMVYWGPILDFLYVMGPDLLAEICAATVILILVSSILTNLPVLSIAKPFPVEAAVGNADGAVPFPEPVNERAARLEAEYDEMARRETTSESNMSQMNLLLVSIQASVRSLEDKEVARENSEKERDKLFTGIALKCTLGIVFAAFAILVRVSWDIYKRVIFGNIRRRTGDTEA